MYAATGEPACREKAEALLDGWAKCIAPDGYFYYSRSRTPRTTSTTRWSADWWTWPFLRQQDGRRFPREDHRLGREEPRAIQAYAFGGTEWYTLSENLYRAHLATGDPRYRDFAQVWEYTDYWDVYAEGRPLWRPRRRPPDGRLSRL